MEKLDLKKITAVVIDGRGYLEERYNRFKEIVSFMQKHIEFDSIKMFLVEDPKISGIEFHKINRFGISDYSRFCLFKLSEYVNTDFCLIFQDDGFIINPDLWKDDFYNYDYIGSPWPLYMGWPKEGEQVGNGGFSLRSKKLLELTKTFTDHSTQNEDTYIVADKKSSLIDAGLKIAPLEIARLFSIENSLDDNHGLNTCFGFHAKHLLNAGIKKITVG
jgi:hypothetical protein